MLAIPALAAQADPSTTADDPTEGGPAEGSSGSSSGGSSSPTGTARSSGELGGKQSDAEQGSSESSAGDAGANEREPARRPGRTSRPPRRRAGAGGEVARRAPRAAPQSRPARAARKQESARAIRDELDGLGDSIRRDTRSRTEGIRDRVLRQLDEPRRERESHPGDRTRKGADEVEVKEVTVAVESGERIELYPGGHHFLVRERVVVRGYEPPRRPGRIVVLQVLTADGWKPVTHARTVEEGRFELVWYPRYPGRYQVRVRPYNSKSTIEPSGVRRIFVYRKAIASWYGPGFYGNRTACGQTFTNRLMGVAHRSLPCGYLVRIRYNGRMKTVPVVDRGPYIDGRDYDLTEALRNYLGFDGVGQVLATA